MKFSLFWLELRYALAALFIGLVLGLATGFWVISVGIALFVFIGFQAMQTIRLRDWLANNAPTDKTPNFLGATDQIVSAVCAIKKENSQKQEKVEELLRRFNTATRAMPDAMLIINETQNIDWANPAAQKLLGIDPQRDIGHRIDNIVRDPKITAYINTKDFSQPLEFSSARSEDNDLMLRIIPYEEDHKLLIVHDHQDLLRLQKVRKSFISNASHEMRTPLTVIIGYLETLALRADTEASIRHGIEGALDQALRLKQLIEDLLSLSRLESLPLSKSQIDQIDIATLIHESVELVKASRLYSNHQFELHIQENVLILGDESELRSAIQNIIENAVKYSPAGSQIEVDWQFSSTNNAAFSVRNCGEFIDKAHLVRLTERFYRIDKGRSRDKGGTGLGLSIVKHVMERHGGELQIDSKKDQGTTVRLCFPKDRVNQGVRKASA